MWDVNMESVVGAEVCNPMVCGFTYGIFYLLQFLLIVGVPSIGKLPLQLFCSKW